MAGEERDARLILRAEDRASRTFEQVASSVRNVRKEIADQSKAAREGTGNLDDLKRSLAELQKAGDDLIRGQSLIRTFESQSEAAEKAEKRLNDVTAALDAYRAKVGENPTDNQSAQIEKRVSAVQRAQQRLEGVQARLAETEQRMQRAGIATDNLETQFDQLASSAVEAAQGIAAAKNAIDEYPAAVKRAADAADEFKAAQDFASRDTSFLKGGEFEFIQSLDSAKAKLAELAQFQALEERQAAASAAAEKQRRADQRQAIEDVYQSSRKLEASFEELANDQKRLGDLSAFRQVGQNAAEDAVKVERYAASVQTLGNDFQSFSTTVRTALGGTQTSLQDVGQAMTQVENAGEALNKPKARINELQETSGRLAIAIATLDRTARQIDGFRIAQQQVQAAEASFAEAQQEVLRLARAVGEADEPAEELTRDLASAQKVLSRAGQEMQRLRNDAVKMGDGLRRAGIDTDNLDAEMQKIVASASRAGDATQNLQSRLRGRGGFLGLNAFELQNLGFQVNDVITTLASQGLSLQSIFMATAQQGGQIVQLFQGLGGAILRAIPLIGAITLLLSPFIGAMVQAARATDSAKDAALLLAGAGEQARGSLQAYTDAGILLRNLGVSAEDANAALKTFHDQGLDPAGLTRYSEALANAAIGGADMGETSKLLTEALTGGSDAVRDLNDAMNILTPSEEAQIEAMLASGQESEARRIIFERFEETGDRMADKARGDWSKAWDDLTFAFNNFSGYVQNSSVWSFLSSAFNTLILDIGEARSAMEGLTYFFNYASQRGLGGAVADGFRALTGNLTAANATEEQRRAAAFAGRGGRADRSASPMPAAATADTREGARAARDLRNELTEAREATQELSREETLAAARRKALLEAVGSPAERQAQADLAAQIAGVKFDEDARKDAERAGKRNKAAADRARRQAEQLANQRRQIAEQLIRDLDALEAKAEKDSIQSLDARLRAVDNAYTGLFQRIEEFRRKGGTVIDGVPVAEYEQQVRAQIAVLRNQEQMAFYEDSINTAIKDRVDQIKAVEEAYDRGDVSPQEAARQTEEIISRFAPQIDGLAADALTFAQSLRTATPDPRLEAFISRMERMQAQNSGGQNRNAAKQEFEQIIAQEAAKLQSIIQQRDALVQAENTLVELGVKTRRDGQAAIEDAYARTTPLIQQQALVMDQLLRQFVERYPEMQLFYDEWQARLAGIQNQTTYVSADFTQLKNGVDGLITQNALAGIDAMAQAFARLALGQQGALATLGDLGIAFANFIAETLIGLGKLILQMILLSAIEKATGIPVGALLKFMNATGLHTGGVVGQERTFSRRVPEAAFLGAPRYHGGGIAGFAPDEVPAILRRNEEVLEETDPRHRFNLGSSDAPADEPSAGLRQVLVLDPSELANALAGPAGEKVVMTHLRRNQTTLKQLTGAQ